MSDYFYNGNLVTSYRAIHTPSTFAKENLIYLQESGALTARSPHESKRQNLDSYLFFIVCSGQGTVEYEGETYHLQAGDCCFLNCMRPYRHHTQDKLWSLKWVHFSGQTMNAIYHKYRERGGKVILKPAEPLPYEDLLTQIYEIAVGHSHIKDMELFEKITALLTMLMKESWDPVTQEHKKGKAKELEHIKAYIDEQYPNKITLEELAEKYYMSKEYLTRMFKNQYGMSLYNYLLQVRITQAKKLLRYSEYSVEQVGMACGIGDANYFSRLFKKFENMSPGEYRKKWGV